MAGIHPGAQSEVIDILWPHPDNRLQALQLLFALQRVLHYCAYGTITTPRLVMLGRTLELGHPCLVGLGA